MRIFCWCDSPTAPTGFGRSAKHVLHALHDAGHELVQLASNLEVSDLPQIPWLVYPPTNRAGDAYGLQDLRGILEKHKPDAMWTTFDPEVPWSYVIPGPQQQDALHTITSLRQSNPGFKAMGWFPVDGGPLSEYEMAVLGGGPYFDAPVTMSPHVHDLVEWTLKLRTGERLDREKLEARLRVIPHAVDLDQYTLPTDEEKRDAKRRLGFDPDCYLILQLERNQQRKQNYLALEVMEMLYRRKPELRGHVKLYQHMHPDEETQGCQFGFHLPELCWRYGLQAGEDVRWPQGWVSEEEMRRTVYPAADAFLSTSAGEGFQYPAWEALATGVPVVVPKDSAREAYFTSAPNAFLYGVHKHRLVMRGGYRRRMSYPKPEEAAAILFKLVHGKRVEGKKVAPESGRVFVSRKAALKDVQDQWVELAAEQEGKLMDERSNVQVAVPSDYLTANVRQVTMMHNPGLGDLVLAAPALRRFKELAHEAGKCVHLRVQRDRFALARTLDIADVYQLEDFKPDPLQQWEPTIHIDELYHPKHQDDWGNPNVHRTHVIAKKLGVSVGELEKLVVALPPEQVQQAQAEFLEAFGVDPTECVALALESGNPHRALPRAYLPELCQRVKALGAVPLLVGSNMLKVRTHGVIDLTGQTTQGYYITLLEMVGAVVTADSSTLHFAGMLGTPTVACFTLMHPDSRLGYYHAPVEVLTPPADVVLGGERFPAGPFPKAPAGAWGQTIKVDDIMAALKRLMGMEDMDAPALVGTED